MFAGNQHVGKEGVWRGGHGVEPGTDASGEDALSEVAMAGGDGLEGPDPTKDDAVHLKRRLGLFSGVALIVGTMIGTSQLPSQNATTTVTRKHCLFNGPHKWDKG